jgi:hypothetical protein
MRPTVVTGVFQRIRAVIRDVVLVEMLSIVVTLRGRAVFFLIYSNIDCIVIAYVPFLTQFVRVLQY